MRRLIALLLLSILTGLPSGVAQTDDSRLIASKRDLAGVLGEAHYIRTLCNGRGDQYWREYMRDFLDLEGDTPSRRSIFIRAFNHGYKYQSGRVKTCSQSSASEEALLAVKGRKLAESIAVAYLN